MYRDGEGVTQNFKAAYKWYKLAAEQGSAYAQSGLGHLYLRGYGVAIDKVQAYMWFNIAATRGDDYASKAVSKLESELAPWQLKKAKNLARECTNKRVKKLLKPLLDNKVTF